MCKENKCPECNSENTFGMSRVVGYYSIIENWNDSKKSELVDRKHGSYKIGETSNQPFEEHAVVEKQKVIMVA